MSAGRQRVRSRLSSSCGTEVASQRNLLSYSSSSSFLSLALGRRKERKVAREPNQDGAGAAADLLLDEVFLAFARFELLLLLSRESLFKYCGWMYQPCREAGEGWIQESALR